MGRDNVAFRLRLLFQHLDVSLACCYNHALLGDLTKALGKFFAASPLTPSSFRIPPAGA